LLALGDTGPERASLIRASRSVPKVVSTQRSASIGGGHYAAAIHTDSAGAISLNNRGTLLGNIDCATIGADDTVINHGVIRGVAFLGDGNDTFVGTGGKSGGVFGETGNDRLAGGRGNDRLHGGDGNDKLTGGLGADRFFFDTAFNAVTNVDTITDFRPVQGDKIVLSESDFPGLGPHGRLAAAHFHVGRAANASAAIIYHPANGFLFYDANGKQAGGMTHFATLVGHPNISISNFLVEA
jgi:Ca2+-binding RTX toxin-like protein